MRNIRIPVEEDLLHEIRIKAAQARLTRRDWVRKALEQATREPEQERQPEVVNAG
jgi:hypothetical protein